MLESEKNGSVHLTASETIRIDVVPNHFEFELIWKHSSNSKESIIYLKSKHLLIIHFKDTIWSFSLNIIYSDVSFWSNGKFWMFSVVLPKFAHTFCLFLANLWNETENL